MSNPQSIEERADDLLTNLSFSGARLTPDSARIVIAAMTQLHDEVFERAARIVEAPFTGVPHTDYAKTRAAVANTLAKDIRAAKLTLPRKRERRVKDDNHTS